MNDNNTLKNFLSHTCLLMGWMAGAGHLVSVRGTGVGHYETPATRPLQRQFSQPKVGVFVKPTRKAFRSHNVFFCALIHKIADILHGLKLQPKIYIHHSA